MVLASFANWHGGYESWCSHPNQVEFSIVRRQGHDTCKLKSFSVHKKLLWLHHWIKFETIILQITVQIRCQIYQTVYFTIDAVHVKM